MKKFYVIFFLLYFLDILPMEKSDLKQDENQIETNKNPIINNIIEILQHNNPANENRLLDNISELYNPDFGLRASQEKSNNNYFTAGIIKTNYPNDPYDRAKAREIKTKQKKSLELKIKELKDILDKDETLKALFVHIFTHIMTNINELRTEILSRKILNYGPEYDPEKANPKLELIESSESLRNTLSRIEGKINNLEIRNKKDVRALKCMVAIYPILTILVIAVLIATNDAISRFVN